MKIKQPWNDDRLQIDERYVGFGTKTQADKVKILLEIGLFIVDGGNVSEINNLIQQYNIL